MIKQIILFMFKFQTVKTIRSQYTKLIAQAVRCYRTDMDRLDKSKRLIGVMFTCLLLLLSCYVLAHVVVVTRYCKTSI